jgi:hypothetical protein
MKTLRDIPAPSYIATSAWTEHVPFALWLTDQIAPRTYVELGTHFGMSYFAFCQAIAKAGLPTKAFAVDTWKGDDHAGFYNDAVYAQVSRQNAAQYAGFSTLLRMTFNEAADQFADGTVDLLHIDGRHGYEDVKEDFKTWLPKLSDRAVVLFHDTEVRERGFGVFRFWAELETRYPSFTFRHGHGLGVLGVGKTQPEAMKDLFAMGKAPDRLGFFQSAFERLGADLAQRVAVALKPKVPVAPLQIPKVKLVIATQATEAEFFEKTATGRSIKRLNFGHLHLRLFSQNKIGLPALYNHAIRECADDPAMLVFMHDDINILSFDWVARLAESLAHYQIVGLAGNKRRVPRQPVWLFPQGDGKHDLPENLSGTVAHGKSYPPDSVDYFGPAPQQVKLLDGLLLCGMSTTFLANDLFFDERFDFHFYDLDLCRSAEQKSVTCGTWPISVIHESPGRFNSDAWRSAYARYLEKWGD